MRALPLSSVVAFASAASAELGSAAPVLPLDTAADTTVTAKPVKRLPRKPKAVKPATVEAAPAAEPAAAPRVIPIMRTCATIARNATNYGGTLSDRDHAYIAFFASFAKHAPGGIVTVRAIVDSGRRPAYSGSSKPHDAGVVNRLRNAGLLTVEADGTSFAFTDAATTLKSYAAGVA